MEVSQEGRWYFFKFEKPPPMPIGEIEKQTANIHLIPANDGVLAQIRKIRPGMLVRMSGYLVQARDPGGGLWKSSMSRVDTGGGAFEVFLVQSCFAY